MMPERRHLICAPLRIAGVPDRRTRRNRAFACLELRARVEQHHLGQAPSAGPRRCLKPDDAHSTRAMASAGNGRNFWCRPWIDVVLG